MTSTFPSDADLEALDLLAGIFRQWAASEDPRFLDAMLEVKGALMRTLAVLVADLELEVTTVGRIMGKVEFANADPSVYLRRAFENRSEA
ncbi:MAG: hypothetical protein WC054_00180 [Candidatus Nanopelagicales bacterium]